MYVIFMPYSRLARISFLSRAQARYHTDHEPGNETVLFCNKDIFSRFFFSNGWWLVFVVHYPFKPGYTIPNRTD